MLSTLPPASFWPAPTAAPPLPPPQPCFPLEEGGFGGGSLAPAPGAEGDLWLALGDAGLYHLTDAGAASAKIESVQGAFSVGFGMAAPGKDYPALYLAGRVLGLQAIFRSDDAGATWVRINDDAHQYGWVSHVTGDPRVYGRVYFATGGLRRHLR